MRIVSYNILDGGEGRANELADVIGSQRPDIVGLVEAENPAVLEQVAGRLGMDYIVARGNSHASALMSRWTIRDTINHAAVRPEISKSLLEATVIDPGGTEWTLGVVHLHARATEADEDIRMKELGALFDAFERHRQHGTPHLICGDFNSNSPVQQIDPSKCKPRTRQEWEQNGGGVPRRVVSRMLEAGYLDSLDVVSPADAAHRGSFTTEFPGQRVDYVFTFGIDPARIKSAWIDQEGKARHASDHFPVGAEID